MRRCDDVCTRSNRGQARMWLDKCECRPAGDWRGGTIVLQHGTEQLGQVWQHPWHQPQLHFYSREFWRDFNDFIKGSLDCAPGYDTLKHTFIPKKDIYLDILLLACTKATTRSWLKCDLLAMTVAGNCWRKVWQENTNTLYQDQIKGPCTTLAKWLHIG